jgi:hypothetical protein
MSFMPIELVFVFAVDARASVLGEVSASGHAATGIEIKERATTAQVVINVPAFAIVYSTERIIRSADTTRDRTIRSL